MVIFKQKLPIELRLMIGKFHNKCLFEAKIKAFGQQWTSKKARQVSEQNWIVDLSCRMHIEIRSLNCIRYRYSNKEREICLYTVLINGGNFKWMTFGDRRNFRSDFSYHARDTGNCIWKTSDDEETAINQLNGALKPWTFGKYSNVFFFVIFSIL